MTADRSLSRLVQLAVTDGVARLGALVALVLTARWLGPTSYGVFAYGYSAGSIAASVTECGMTSYLMREAAAQRLGLQALVRLVVQVRLWLTILSAVAVGAIVQLATRDRTAMITGTLLAAALSLRSVSQSHIAALLGRGDARAGLLQQFLERMALLATLVALLAVGGGTPSSAALAFVISAAAGWSVTMVLWRRSPASRGPAGSAPRLAEILHDVWPLAVAAIGVAGFLYSGTLLLGLLATQREAGEYGAALGLYVPLVGLPAMVMKSTMAELAGDDPGPHTRLALGRLVFGAIVLPGLLALAAPEISSVVLGADYLRSDDVLAVLALGAAASFGSSFFYYYAIARRLERSYTVAVLLACGTNLALAPYLIRLWGAVGAAVGLAGAESLCLVTTAWLTRQRFLEPRRLFRSVGGPAVAGMTTLAGASVGLLAARALDYPAPVRLALTLGGAAALSLIAARRVLVPPPVI